MSNLKNDFEEEDDETIKNYVIMHDWCSSKVSENDLSIKKTECDSTAKSYYGLITLYEYARASIDENCTTLSSGSCKNYNFIVNNFQEPNFTFTVAAENSYEVYTVYLYDVRKTKVSSNAKITLAAYISGNNNITSGNGSKESPYILK